MNFTWAVDCEQGFDKSLLPRIRKAQAGLKRGAGKDAVSGRITLNVLARESITFLISDSSLI